MKEKLIKYIEAYAAARVSRNDVLIAHAIEKLDEIMLEVFSNDKDSE